MLDTEAESEAVGGGGGGGGAGSSLVVVVRVLEEAGRWLVSKAPAGAVEVERPLPPAPSRPSREGENVSQ